MKMTKSICLETREWLRLEEIAEERTGGNLSRAIQEILAEVREKRSMYGGESSKAAFIDEGLPKFPKMLG